MLSEEDRMRQTQMAMQNNCKVQILQSTLDNLLLMREELYLLKKALFRRCGGCGHFPTMVKEPFSERVALTCQCNKPIEYWADGWGLVNKWNEILCLEVRN